MGADSVLLGDRRQGSREHLCGQGNKEIAGLPPEVLGPRGRYLTGLVGPCGALPRKCLFSFLTAAVIVMPLLTANSYCCLIHSLVWQFASSELSETSNPSILPA
jgi:hypothetical protein